MAALTVGTTAVELEGAQGAIVTIQNKGTGVVTLLETSGGGTGDGITIDVDEAYEPPRPFPGKRWLISDTAGTDVRLHGA